MGAALSPQPGPLSRERPERLLPEQGGPRAAGGGGPALRAAASNPASCGPGNGPARLCPDRALLGAAAAARTPALQRGRSGSGRGTGISRAGTLTAQRLRDHGCRFTQPSVGAIPPGQWCAPTGVHRTPA